MFCSVIIGVVVYLVVGVIVMKVKYQAAGVDLIPNKAFWKSVPFLIKVYCSGVGMGGGGGGGGLWGLEPPLISGGAP